MTQDRLFDQMADGVIDTLASNGVEPQDYSVFIPRILGASLKENSRSYNKVIKRINAKIKKGVKK